MRLPALLLICIGSFPAAAEDWPRYLKDPSHSSFNRAESILDIKNIATLKPAWTYSAGARVGSSVTLASDVLYFGDWDGNFHAVEAQRGVLLWKSFLGKAATPSDPSCFPSIGVSSQSVLMGDTVYVGGGDSALYALNRSNGRTLWRVPLADPAAGSYLWSSVVAYQNALYIGVASLGDCPTVRGAVARIDPRDPQNPLLRYVVPEGATGGGIWSTPVADAASDSIFVTTGNGDVQDAATGYWNGAILELDSTTLETRAHYLFPESDAVTDLVGGSSPILFTDGRTPMLAVAQKNGILYAVRRDGLSPVWQTPLAVSCSDPAEGCGAISTPAFDGKALYLGAGVRDAASFGFGTLYAIQPTDGSVLWRKDLDTTILSPTTVANGLLYVSTTRGLEIYDTSTGQAVWSDNTSGGPLFSQPVVANGTIYSTYLRGDLVAWTLPPPSPNTLVSFSAASGIPSLAPGAAASAYGSDLLHAQVTVEDSAGVRRPAQVVFSSANQINYVVPEETSPGRATITATSQGTVSTGALQVNAVAPGLFSANSDGQGVAAAQALRLHADGTLSSLSVFRCDPGCASEPIDPGTAEDRTFLIFYGTGIRHFTNPADLHCRIGGVDVPVTYAGAQPAFAGLDQVNVEILPSLQGRGEVDVTLTVDGQLSNTVTLNFR